MPSRTGEKSTRSRGRSGGAAAAWGSGKCIPLIRAAEARKETAFSRNTVLRPKYAATTPPTAAPIIRLTDQVAEESVLATNTSLLSAILGITALRAEIGRASCRER